MIYVSHRPVLGPRISYVMPSAYVSTHVRYNKFPLCLHKREYSLPMFFFARTVGSAAVIVVVELLKCGGCMMTDIFYETRISRAKVKLYRFTLTCTHGSPGCYATWKSSYHCKFYLSCKLITGNFFV